MQSSGISLFQVAIAASVCTIALILQSEFGVLVKVFIWLTKACLCIGQLTFHFKGQVADVNLHLRVVHQF